MKAATKERWEKDQAWEADWHGLCLNSFDEEKKQIEYMIPRMGLVAKVIKNRWPVLDLKGKNVVDVGGGPYSLLLKAINKGDHCAIVDPCEYPLWVQERYKAAGIHVYQEMAETFIPCTHYDEVWMYNLLQHVQDPEAVVRNIRTWGVLLRVCEWIGCAVAPGHPHSLTAEWLDTQFEDTGYVSVPNPKQNKTPAWSGVFIGQPWHLGPTGPCGRPPADMYLADGVGCTGSDMDQGGES